ncbi:hypothetical protein [Halobacterium yunchengense]|uniref:hypothetical protein n=1 Tax=Halobacterium yunchengense TaxID=3108497 RepID=UPI0030095878
MDTNAVVRRAALQSLVTALGFAIAAVLLAGTAADVAAAMWRTVAALVALAVVGFGVAARDQSR